MDVLAFNNVRLMLRSSCSYPLGIHHRRQSRQQQNMMSIIDVDAHSKPAAV